MLILAREIEQTIIINDNIKITVKKINENSVKFAIDAPQEIHIEKKVKPEEVKKKLVNTYLDSTYLGILCNRNHDYRNTGKSMRYVSGSCIGCIQEKSKAIGERLLTQKKNPKKLLKYQRTYRKKKKDEVNGTSPDQ
jgi:carbon storage regulator CsrA